MPLATGQHGIKGTEQEKWEEVGGEDGDGAGLTEERRGMVKRLCFLSPHQCVCVCWCEMCVQAGRAEGDCASRCPLPPVFHYHCPSSQPPYIFLEHRSHFLFCLLPGSASTESSLLPPAARFSHLLQNLYPHGVP
ncbi:unnamed protein product [Rangifer tarandus platyrhynchus]|uniref:Uncharacterized protein n=1 Tax=Rangifer tarandus platyrhynchus TaxID=3082113 RepID=A0AC60AAK9_RANTA